MLINKSCTQPSMLMLKWHAFLKCNIFVLYWLTPAFVNRRHGADCCCSFISFCFFIFSGINRPTTARWLYASSEKYSSLILLSGNNITVIWRNNEICCATLNISFLPISRKQFSKSFLPIWNFEEKRNNTI